MRAPQEEKEGRFGAFRRNEMYVGAGPPVIEARVSGFTGNSGGTTVFAALSILRADFFLTNLRI